MRSFLEFHEGDGEVERIRSIPKGKWNYLPEDKGNVIDPTEVIGLYAMNNKNSVKGIKDRDVGFVKIYSSGKNRGPFSSIRAKYIEDQEALKKIKASSDNNKSGIDTIKINREEYIAKGKTEIEVQFDNNKTTFNIKPSHKKALEIVGDYFTIDILGIVQRGIKFSNEKREFEHLVRKLNKETKELGSPFTTTVRKFETFINKLLEKEIKERKLEEIEGVLFYAHHK